MTLHIEIHTFSDNDAYGCIVLDETTVIPISMPISSYEQAIENKLLTPSYFPYMAKSEEFSEHEIKGELAI